MSIRNLDAIFQARSVALIGASPRAGSLGKVVLENLRAGGFAGPILAVNPKHTEVDGLTCYPDIASLPLVPDLAIICTPPKTVPELIGALGARGTKGAIIITAGFQELGNAEGRALEQAVLDAARPHLLRIIGPNCLGVLSTPASLNASFAPGQAAKGHVAFVAQSGAVVTTVLDWASARGIGFSHLVSLGDMTDVDFGDMLDYLALDPATSAILLYIEAVTDARKFLSAARVAARAKPVIAIKAGRHAQAAKAAASHTGALAGVDAVYDAAFSRAGILRVRDLDEVFDAVQTLSMAPEFTGDTLTILTNGGGIGVLATDALLDLDGTLAELNPQTKAKLDVVLPPTWSHGNPVDIIGDAPGKRYADALSILLDAPETNAVLVINCPTAVASSTDAARAVIDTLGKTRRNVLTNWLGGNSAHDARTMFITAGIPTYDTPNEAIRGFMHLVRYHKAQDVLMEVPSATAADIPDGATARAIVDEALAAGGGWLSGEPLQRLFGCYGIPIVRSAHAATPEDVARIAKEFGGPIALKIQSPDITHKSDIGGVSLNLPDADAAQREADAMLKRVAQAAPKAQLEGFLVQDMVNRPGAYELILGMAVDRQFGPFLLFGQGGTAVEVIGDKALGLPPLNLSLARVLIAETRVARLLSGYRDHPPAAIDAIALTLVRLSQLVCDFDAVVEIDINPLLADANGVMATDARLRLEAPPKDAARGARLAIRPYPKACEKAVTLPGIGPALLRPVRPEDAAEVRRMLAKMPPEDVRMRFFVPPGSLEPHLLARLTQIDYEREMVFVLQERGGSALHAIARLAADPDNETAEFAIAVHSDRQGQGIGRFMMQHLVSYARERGLSQLSAEILLANAAMLALCRDFGFTLTAGEQEALAVRAILRL
jgi:acetyltransferase